MKIETALTMIWGLGIVAFMFLPATGIAKKRYGFDEDEYCPLWRILKKAIGR